MPIFMDLHSDPGITAKNAAEAHLLDVEIQDNYKCKCLTLWIDEPQSKAFCLFEAPNANAVLELHKNAHGGMPYRIIEVKEEKVQLFLGRLSVTGKIGGIDELEEIIVGSPYRTLMQVETKSAMVESKSLIKAKSHCTNEIFREIIDGVKKNYSGREAKNIFDECIISFDSVENSIHCALEIEQRIEKYNSKTRGVGKILFTIGIDLGSPVSESKELFGDSIQLLKRICSFGKEGQIIASSSIREMFKSGKLDIKKSPSVSFLSPKEESFLKKLSELTEKMWNDEKYNLDNFSKEIGLSKAQLYRKVTGLTGYSPNVFIREYRLTMALKAIENMKGNIAEIAIESGFNNPSYFSKCFHKKFGILPSEYANAII